jgi:hypothetical protein
MYDTFLFPLYNEFGMVICIFKLSSYADRSKYNATHFEVDD